MSATEVVHGWNELQAALPAYEVAEAFYDGTRAEVFAHARIRQMLQETGRRYRFNLAKTPVDVIANKLEVTAITDPKSQAVTDRITEIMDANDMDVYLPDAILKACEYGDSYIMVWEADDDTPITDGLPEDAEPDPGLEKVNCELTVHNPKNVRMIYDPENHRRKWYVIKRWCVPRPGGTERWRVDIWFADRVERWVSVSNTGMEKEEGWKPFTGWPEGDEESEVLENPFNQLPFFHFRTAHPYGIPVHLAAYPAQDAINKILITQINTTDTQGWPARFALMEAGGELDQNNDDPDFPTGDDAAATRDSDRAAKPSSLRAGPGTLNYLPGVKALLEFPGADPDKFLAPAEFYIRLMSQLTGIPMHHFDPAGEVPSGESLKVKDGPLNKHVLNLQRLLKAPMSETFLFALFVVGVKTKALEIRWAPAETATGKSDWETIGLKQGAGVPQRTTLVEAGYEPESVDEWLDDEAEEMDLFRRADLLEKVAGAAQKLGAAVSLGVMTAEQAQEVIVMITGQKAVPVEGPPEPAPPADPNADPNDEPPAE